LAINLQWVGKEAKKKEKNRRKKVDFNVFFLIPRGMAGLKIISEWSPNIEVPLITVGKFFIASSKKHE